MNNISFLLGAGFSKPAKYPLASDINIKFRNLSLEEFYIHTSEAAYLTKTQNENWIVSREKHHFVVEFIQFYCSSILKSKEDFHYETFFDYYIELMKRRPNDVEAKFFTDFSQKQNYDWDHFQLLFQFNRTFQQLVANFITIEWPKSGHYLAPHSPSLPHKQFLELMDKLKDDFKVHIHTLNHDLLMEKYFHYDPLAGNYSDGFCDFASPYYGLISNNERTQRIRLKRFKDKYDAIFNLYKLHGSVDNYVFNTNNKTYDMIKSEYGLLERGIVKEVTTHTGEEYYDDGHVDVVPEFLSGTFEKIKNYGRKLYYSRLFERFKYNLNTSNCLIVIGYGFADPTINDYLRDHFLFKSSHTMIVINKTRPESSILNNKSVNFFQVGVEELQVDMVEEIIRKNYIINAK